MDHPPPLNQFFTQRLLLKGGWETSRWEKKKIDLGVKKGKTGKKNVGKFNYPKKGGGEGLENASLWVMNLKILAATLFAGVKN